MNTRGKISAAAEVWAMGLKWGLIAALVGFSLSLPAAPGVAAVLVEELFEGGGAPGGRGKLVATSHGKGWQAGVVADSAENGAFLRYPASVLNADEGAIELEIVRNEKEQWEGIFGLVDEQGRNLAYATFFWEGSIWTDGKPFIDIGNGKGIPRLWNTEVRSGSERGRFDGVFLSGAGKGSSVHLVFTWGRNAADCAIYLNGRRLPADVDVPFGMGEAIRGAKWLVVGAEPSGETGATAQMNSTIEYVRFYDQPIDGAALHTPDRYASKLMPDLATASLSHDASRVAGFSGKLVAGNTLTVTMEGASGARGTFDLVHYPDFDRKIALDWRGWGVYLEDKVFLEPEEVNLRDVEGYRVYASREPFDPAALSVEPVEGAPPPMEPVERLDIEEQSYTLESLEIDTPYYVAVVAEMRDGTLRPVIAPIANRSMTESEPGVFTGSYQIGYRDRYPRAVVVGHLAKGVVTTSLAGDARSAFTVDPALTIAVATQPKELKADEKSTAKVTVTVTDANGNPVSGHKMKFLLATTSQYTGVVGGGAFADQVGGSMKESAFGETDLFGRITATYVAGFAAKTAVIVARDMASDDTGAGYVKTYIQTAAELELEPVVQAMSMMDTAYQITVTSSDEWLTADGKSQARITARVTLNGKPVEGHKVNFDASPGAGSIRVVQGTTGRDGEARAVFTAGLKIGIALVTATDVTVGISGSVAIELRSDAPAKIVIQIKPEKLPADGRSRADVLVQVTDINDNPNDNVEVEFRVAQGGGSVRDKKGMTDRRGESATEYVAGRSPGRVSIEITVRSTEPTEEEILKARGLAVAVTDGEFF